MILTTLMVASLLNVSDPSGDAVGAGQLAVPKAAIFRELANFDVLNLSIADQNIFAFEISMASLENPWELPLGFSLPIIEVYAAIDPVKRNSSRNALLPGSGMQIRPSDKWNYAFRITGNAIDVYTVEEGEAIRIDNQIALSYTITDNRIKIETNIKLAGDISVYAMAGSYDPFSATGWRNVGIEGQPWILSSSTQDTSVLDVVVDDFSMQQRSIQAGILPEITAAARQPSWLWVVVAGLLTCLLALIARPRKVLRQAEVIEAEQLQAKHLNNLEDNKVSDDATLEETVLESSVLNQPNKVAGKTISDAVEPPIYSEPDLGRGSSVSKAKTTTKHRPIQWTSWDEGDTVGEDTMIEFDRIASEESEARATQPHPLNVEVFDPPEQESEPTQVDEANAVIAPTNGTKPFQENLLPDVEEESLLSNKQPPKGFTNRMKQFGLEEVEPDDVSASLDEEELDQNDSGQG